MKSITIIVALYALGISARGQSFMNLNFESAQKLTNNPGSGVLVSATNAMPYWTAYDGSLALADVYYVSNYISGTAASVALEAGTLALSGDWSVGLYLGGSISQTGLVPGNAASLQFEAYGPGPGGSLGASGLGVTLSGQSLSFSPLSQGPNYTLYGANVPADLDGQTEPLTFLTQGSGGVLLDNIGFWPTNVPEPSELALISLSAILLGLCRRRKYSNSTHQPAHGLCQ